MIYARTDHAVSIGKGDQVPGDENDAYLVVVNDEGQYSIWRAERVLPAGWRAEGTAGTRADCLAHIDQVWTDLRPLSLQQRMDNSKTA
jgi:MbtH protein